MQAQEKNLQEMQILEQNMQNLILQKQAFEMELSETESAMVEMEKSGEEVFKIIGQLVIKSEKSKIKEELEAKKKFLSARLNSFEKQEAIFSRRIEEIRGELLKHNIN